MRALYPEIAPFNAFYLDVGPPHRLHVEEAGNPGGIPVVFLHGGPGTGCNENHRRYFDPARYRVVLFDQRGCHRSAPRGSVEDNTTQRLLADIERIRLHLNIDRWVLFGGSWGATLGLLYAQQNPGRVLAMILRGVFLARRAELDWFARDGANRIFPDYWADFVQSVPESQRHDLVAALHAHVHGRDPEAKRRAARAWSTWATRVTTYLLPEASVEEEDPDRMLDQVAIETHYAYHRYFIAENHILASAVRLPDVPTRIIHGRRDLTCTLEGSWALHRAAPRSELLIVNEGGHLAGEPVMTDALIAATDDLASRLS
ncbi:MAG: prolyl aminopeptidase [Gammaproteobacteria bacterium]|nr:prolyl aminopeptidase [Gammaproteobacteria bacterium]